jgi:FMN phosphatase YigB (HAD superfamily)
MASGCGIPVVAVAGSVAPDVFGSLAAAGVTSIQTLSTPSQRRADYLDKGKARRLLREAGVRIAPVVEVLSKATDRIKTAIPQSDVRREVSTQSYELVVLDLWQTVITRNWKHNFVEAVVRSLAGVGLDVGHTLVQECLGVSMLRRRLDRETFASRLMDFVSGDSPPDENQRQMVLGILRSVAGEQTRQAEWILGAPQFLEAMRREGALLVAVSNSTQEVDDVLSKLGVRSYFDEVVLSYDVGLAKPNLGLFLHSKWISQAHAERRRTVLVGDQFDKDIVPAQLLGFDAVLLKHGSKAQKPCWHRTHPAIGMAASFAQLSVLLNQREAFPTT